MNFDTNTICKCFDIDIYLLYFIEITPMVRLLELSKEQYQIMHKQQFIKELFIINSPEFKKKYGALNGLQYLKSNIIDNAALDNYISLIKYMYKSATEFKYTSNAIKYASYNNHINILDWFAKICYCTHKTKSKSRGRGKGNFAIAKLPAAAEKCVTFFLAPYEFKYDTCTIDWAAYNGHVSVLEWFDNSIYEFKYSSNAIDRASEHGHMSILEWFDKSKYEFKYTSGAIDYASQHGHISILEWFSKSKYKFKYTFYAIHWASEKGNILILQWLDKAKYDLIYTSYPINLVS